MKVHELWKFHGNVKRILEMEAAGIGANAIAGTFQDHGINMSANDVRGIIKATAELSRKALPKKTVRQLVDQTKLGGLEAV